MDEPVPHSKWSELPLDILMRLFKLITDSNISTCSFSYKLQILLFRAVCKSWRSALKSQYNEISVSCNIPIPIPTALLPSLFPSSSDGPSQFYELSRELNGSFYLVPSIACILQSVKNPSSSHVLVVEHLSYESDKVCCRRPLFTTHDRSSSWDVNSSKSINLLDYRVSVVAEEYCLRFLINDNGVLRLGDSYENLCKKAVLIRNLKSEELDGVAIVLFNNTILAEYSFTENKWNVLYDGKKSKCSDIVRYEDACIVLDHKGNAFRVAYDFNSRALGWTLVASEIHGCRTRRRLVVDLNCGDLYLVVRNTFYNDRGNLKVSFSLYWFSEELHKWERHHGIPGLILCVGLDFSFFASGKNFPTISSGTGNCIFSTIGSFKMYDGVGNVDSVFGRMDDDCCVFHLGDYCANKISNHYRRRAWMEMELNDYTPMFCSPSKWEELNVPPLCAPHCSIEQSAVPVEKKSGQNPGAHSSLAEEDEKAGRIPMEHTYHDDRLGRMVLKEKGKKKKRTSDDSGSSKHSRLPKTRKVTLSSTEHPGSEETPLPLMKRLVAYLENNPVSVHTVEPRCTLPEVLQDLGSLPNVEVGSNFYFSSCRILHKKENREAYMCLVNALAKYKWLSFMCKRSQN